MNRPDPVKDLAKTIAPVFGAVLESDQMNPGSEWGAEGICALVRDDGFRLSFSRGYGARANKVQISGSLTRPEEMPNAYRRDYPGSISVSLSRKPTEIVNDIYRRLVPNMEKAAEHNRERRRTEVVNELGQERTRDSIVDTLGGLAEPPVSERGSARSVRLGHDRANRSKVYHYLAKRPGQNYNGSFEWETNMTGDEVSIEGRWLPRELALAIARTIADWEGAR